MLSRHKQDSFLMEFLQMKNTMSKTKNILDRINNSKSNNGEKNGKHITKN